MSAPPLSPFIIGAADNLERLPTHLGNDEIVKIPIDASNIHLPDSMLASWREHGISVASSISPARFARLLNLANGVAYGGGMGMPEWVMLDCALLPSFFAGFMGPSALLSSLDQNLIREGLCETEDKRSDRRTYVERELKVAEGDLGLAEWFPIAEFCAIPRVAPHELVGYSLYSLKRGYGGRAKAFGLWLLHSAGYRYQVGVAQWTNPAAIKAHLRFGPLELIDPMTPSHTKAGETFIYRLHLHRREDLLSRALGEGLNH